MKTLPDTVYVHHYSEDDEDDTSLMAEREETIGDIDDKSVVGIYRLVETKIKTSVLA